MLLAAYLVKHDTLGGMVCTMYFVLLVLVLFLPHTWFTTVPLFTLCWLGGAATWLGVALLLDRIPLFSSGGHQYPDVALEDTWALTLQMFRFYQEREEALFHVNGEQSPLGGFMSPSQLVGVPDRAPYVTQKRPWPVGIDNPLSGSILNKED